MRLLILLLLCVSAGAAHAQIPADSLQALYRFDGALEDESGNERHIVNASGSFTVDRFGNPNHAFLFNGVNDSLVLPVPEFAPIQGDFTFSFWYRTNSSALMNLFSSKEFPTDTTSNFEVQLNSNSLYYQQYNPQLWYQTYVYWNGAGSPPNGIGEGNPGHFSKGEWSHFVLTREADTLKIYRNHQHYIFSAESYFGGVLGDAVDLLFSAAPHRFKGAIDDLALYNRALSPAEIDLLYFERNPILFVQPKPNDAYVQGSELLVFWEYDSTQLSDSIMVEYRINNGPWIAAVHSNHAYEYYTTISMTYPPGTTVEVRVSDFSDPTLFASTGSFIVSEYDWVEVASELPFPAKDGAGLLHFNNSMWLLGGWDPPNHPPHHTHSEVWNSTDGATWTYVNEAPWPARHCGGWIASDNAMWVIGGDPQSGCLTDVWKTTDGLNWSQQLETIPGYSIRNMANHAYFDDQLILFGGEDCSYGGGLNEVWQSADGINWMQLPDAPWTGRGMQLNSCVDGAGQLWMLGGSNERDRRSFNEVWKTADGINWILVNESAPWSGRYWHTVAWFDNKMWLLGGMATGIEMNDAWYSEDGITWYELKSATGNWPAGSRHAQSTTVYDNALWYMCGISTNNVWKIIDTQNPVSVHEQINDDSSLHVFPNPTNGLLTVERKSNAEVDFVVCNAIGQIVVRGTLKGSTHRIDLSAIPSGLYTLQIMDETKLLHTKLIKE